MSPSAEQLFTSALSMTEKDRGWLAASLIESLNEESESQATEEWDAEIARRLAEIREGRVTMVPWAEARRAITPAADPATS